MTPDPLAAYLVPRGAAPGIGDEKGPKAVPAQGIAKYTSPHGSTRYVYYVDATPVAALQVVSRDGKSASIANVYTDPAHRKQGYAKKLLLRARKDFRSVVHASEGNISDEGEAWRAAVDAPVNVKSGVALKPVRTYL